MRAGTAEAESCLARQPFEDVYREFLPRILGYVSGRLSSHVDAEDVTAQVFVRAFVAYGRFRQAAPSPAPWLFAIARNAASDHVRRLRQRQELERLAISPTSVEDPRTLAEDRLSCGAIKQALAALPVRQRQVIFLRSHGFSFQEAGGRLGCSEDAAKMLYHRAIRALRPLRDEAA
jgi:RNA polymerase sigma factor (sigma-70 family)